MGINQQSFENMHAVYGVAAHESMLNVKQVRLRFINELPVVKQ